MDLLKLLKPFRVLHFVGCYAITLTAISLGTTLLGAFVIAAALGLLWEILDAFNQANGWKFPLLDPRGGDIVDYVIDLSGAAFAIFISIL